MSWAPPPYPYDRLEPARAKAEALEGGVVDVSIGTPMDPPPQGVLDVLAEGEKGREVRSYPPSVGTIALRRAAQEWMATRFSIDVPVGAVAACVGTKELVATLPQWLKLRTPGRDTVLFPAVAYPTYEMGALLAGLRPVPVALDAEWRIDLASIDPADAARALLLWVNSPGNPAGALDDLSAAADWGARFGVPVFSDECYAELTWKGEPQTILGKGGGKAGLEGVVALHSLSKRSNLAGLRVGWFAGDPELVGYLAEVRKHAGMMVPGPVQRAAVAALADQGHVELQRERYHRRLVRLAEILRATGVEVALPEGGIYLWAPAPGGDAWAWADHLAATGGLLVSPGDLYGPGGAGYSRLAAVVPDEQIELVARRLAS